MLKYFKQAIDLYRQAKDLAKAEKRLRESELDYLMLEKLIKGTNKEIVVKLANGTTITVKENSETGFVPFSEKYARYHS